MKLAMQELWRRPRTFVVPLGILMLLAVLLLYPSAILDGVLQETTAAMRNAPADLVVYSNEANGVIARSRIDPALRQRVDDTPGTSRVATFDAMLFTGRVEGGEEPLSLALLASDHPIGPRVPGPGEALADPSLRDKAGIAEGDTLIVGPFRVPVRVVGFTDGINLAFAHGLVVDKGTWLAAFGPAGSSAEPQSGGSAAASDADVPASQALFVSVDEGADDDEVAAAIDRATEGTTRTMTKSGAVEAIPGVEQQQTTFGYIRGVTVMVALVVVGLFLSFITLERASLYAVLKAVGTSSSQLFVGLATQVTAICDIAVWAALLITWGLTFLPLELPTEIRWAQIGRAHV